MACEALEKFGNGEFGDPQASCLISTLLPWSLIRVLTTLRT